MKIAALGDQGLARLESLVTQGHFEEAATEYRSLVALGTEMPAESHLAGARAIGRTGQIAPARDAAAESLALFRRSGNQQGALEATNLLGVFAFERGEIDIADSYFTQVCLIAGRLSNQRFVCRALNNLASIAHLRGRIHESIDLYQRALRGYHQLEDDGGIAETSHNLALVHRRVGDLPLAAAAVHEAVRHAERAGQTGLCALAYLGRAELAIERSRFSEARDDIQRALTRMRLAGDAIGVVEAGRLRALLSLREGHALQAHLQAETVRALARQQGAALLEAEAVALSALALRVLGDPREAEQYRNIAVDLLHHIGAQEQVERFRREWNATV